MNILAGALVISMSLGVSPAEVDWGSHYGNALREARQGNRPMIIVLEHSEASLANARQLRAKTNQTLLNQFVLCRVDVSTEYGEQVAAAFHVNKFPYTVVTDKQAQRVVYRRVGKISSRDWVATLTRIRDGQAKDKGKIGGTENAKSVADARPVTRRFSATKYFVSPNRSPHATEPSFSSPRPGDFAPPICDT